MGGRNTRRWVGALLLTGLLGGSGCDVPAPPHGRSSAPPGTLAVEDFVAVVVALRQAERTLAEADSTEETFGERRDQVLAEHDVTDEDLREFVEAYDRDPDFLAAVWDTINDRLKRPANPEDDAMETRPGPRAF